MDKQQKMSVTHAEFFVLDAQTIVVNIVQIRTCLVPSRNHRAHGQTHAPAKVEKRSGEKTKR